MSETLIFKTSGTLIFYQATTRDPSTGIPNSATTIFDIQLNHYKLTHTRTHTHTHTHTQTHTHTHTYTHRHTHAYAISLTYTQTHPNTHIRRGRESEVASNRK